LESSKTRATLKAQSVVSKRPFAGVDSQWSASPPTSKGKYQLFPDLTPAEYEALKTSIADRGVDIAIIVDAEFGTGSSSLCTLAFIYEIPEP
jgi:hypothetical protein